MIGRTNFPDPHASISYFFTCYKLYFNLNINFLKQTSQINSLIAYSFYKFTYQLANFEDSLKPRHFYPVTAL